MRKRMILPLAAGLMFAGCSNQTAKVPALDLTNLDTSVAPGDDFYQYACGGWMQKNPLKGEYSRFGSFDLLRENNKEQLKELFLELGKETHETGSVAQKIGDLYNMGLDSVRLNEEGAKPLGALLEDIENLSGKSEICRMAGTMQRTIANPFFGIYVDADMKNSSNNIVYWTQGGIAMGDRDYYIVSDEENKKIREAYKTYIHKLFTLAGYSEKDADRAVKSVMKVENALAKAASSREQLRDPQANYNMLSVKELKAKYNNIDWKEFLNELTLSGLDKINVGQLASLEAVNNIIGTYSERTLKDYLAFYYIDAASSYLSDDFVDANFEFYGKTLSGKEEKTQRWKSALEVPNSLLSEAVSEMYVAKYFSPESKNRMIKLVGDLQEALGQHIDALEWMSDETKVKAKEKLATFYVKIGYPDKWTDYTNLTINPSESYLANIMRAIEFATLDQIKNAGMPVDKDKWYMSPQTVNAYYNPTTNEICFPAAILQPPFFNPEADDAVNYGAIGVVIGHEMTHGFDDQGRQFDKVGNLEDWWTDADAAQFTERAEKLAAQFDAIEVAEGTFANGHFTLGENIADQGGLRVAYTAYRNSLNGVEPAPIDGFTADQRFYLGYATLWAVNIREAEILRLTRIDPHSLGKWRVNASLRNIETFFNAFDIKEGDPMYLAPEKRVVIW